MKENGGNNVQTVGQNGKRIAVIMGKFATGGIKSVLLNYYHNIDRSRIQFDFIVDDDSPLTDFDEITELGGRVYTISSLKHPIRFMHECYRIFEQNQYQCVHAYINTLNVFPMFVARVAGVPVRIAENLSTGHRGEAKTVIKQILKIASTWFSNILAANSEYAAIWLYGAKKAKDAVIIRNGLDLNVFRFSESIRHAVRTRLGLKDGDLLFGHIGRFEYQKNHNFLINVFKAIHDENPTAKLLLVGYGSLRPQVLAQVEALGLTESVIDCGATEKTVPLYNAMDCFILPSYYEGLPVVGIEAQATGLPCLFSSEITREVKITNDTEFLSLDDNVKKWAQEATRLATIHRRNQSDSIRKAGYDITVEAKKLEQLYLSSIIRFARSER